MPAPRKSPTAKKRTIGAGRADFRWTSPAGTVISIPLRAADIKAGLLRKVRHMDGYDAMFSLFEAVCDEKNLALIDDLTLAETDQMLQAWQEKTGAKLPEA